MAAGSASNTPALMNKVGWDATKGIVEGTTLEAGEYKPEDHLTGAWYAGSWRGYHGKEHVG